MCVADVEATEHAASASSKSGFIPLKAEDGFKFSELYSQVVVEADICARLTTREKEIWNKLGKAFGFKQAGLFTGELTVSGLSGTTFPHLYPYSYTYDTDKAEYDTKLAARYTLPWQVGSSGYSIVYKNKVSKTADSKVAAVLANLTTKILDVSPGGTLMSAATKGYIDLASSVVDNTATIMLTDGVKSDEVSTTIDFSSSSPSSRGIIFRLRDNNAPKPRQYAAVKVTVAFKRSLVEDLLKEKVGADGTKKLMFSTWPNIVDLVRAPGPNSTAMTLRELLLLSKTQSYLYLVKANDSTNVDEYHSKCEDLRKELSTSFGLNSFDVALAMGDILRSTNYVTSSKLSGTEAACINQGDLATLASMDLAVRK